MQSCKEVLKKLQEQYPIGARVELVQMNDPQAPPMGTKGTIYGVDDWCNIFVRWDNGSWLNAIYGVDVIRRV